MLSKEDAIRESTGEKMNPGIAVYWKSFADYGCPYCGFRYQVVHTRGGKDFIVRCHHCGADYIISFSAYSSCFNDLRVFEHPLKGQPSRGFLPSEYDSFVPDFFDNGKDLIEISLTKDIFSRDRLGEGWRDQKLSFKPWLLVSQKLSDLCSGLQGMCFLMSKEHVCGDSALRLSLFTGYRDGRGVAERFRLVGTLMMSYVEFGGVFALQMGVCQEHAPNAEHLSKLVTKAGGKISYGHIIQAKEYIP